MICCCLGGWFRVVVVIVGGFQFVALFCISCCIGVTLWFPWLLHWLYVFGFGLIWCSSCVFVYVAICCSFTC